MAVVYLGGSWRYARSLFALLSSRESLYDAQKFKIRLYDMRVAQVMVAVYLNHSRTMGLYLRWD